MATFAKPCLLNPFLDLEPYRLPGESPDQQMILPIVERFWEANGPFQHILKCGKVKYNLLIQFNEDEEASECEANACLRKIYGALKNGDREMRERATQQALSIFLNFVEEDYRGRVERGEVSKSYTVKMQIKTVRGELITTEHELEFDIEGNAVQNPFVDVRKIAQHDIKRVKKLSRRIYLVEVNGTPLCLKVSRWRGEKQFLQEINKMRSLPRNRNLIHLVGVADAGDGKIGGILMPFVKGQNLQFAKSIDDSKKKKWKSEIQMAVTLLHEKGIIWGDAKPENIIIDEATDSPVLFDFEGGTTLGWIDKELENTVEGDSQGVARILDFVDQVPSG